MASIKELLAEANQFKTGVQKLAGGGLNKTASGDVISDFAEQLMAGEFDSAPQQQIEKQAAQEELCEKVAEATMVLESLYSLALGKIKEDLVKEAAASNEEIDQLLEKIAVKMKLKPASSAVKMALGVLGFGAVGGGAGYAIGREHGRDKGIKDAKHMLAPVNSYGPGGM
jgi:hypothetical protein